MGQLIQRLQTILLRQSCLKRISFQIFSNQIMKAGLIQAGCLEIHQASLLVVSTKRTSLLITTKLKMIYVKFTVTMKDQRWRTGLIKYQTS